MNFQTMVGRCIRPFPLFSSCIVKCIFRFGSGGRKRKKKGQKNLGEEVSNQEAQYPRIISLEHETTRQEMEVHICCRQALRTTEETAQRGYRHTKIIQLWCAFGRKASPVGKRHVSSAVKVKTENLCGTAVQAKQCLHFRLKVKKS